MVQAGGTAPSAGDEAAGLALAAIVHSSRARALPHPLILGISAADLDPLTKWQPGAF